MRPNLMKICCAHLEAIWKLQRTVSIIKDGTNEGDAPHLLGQHASKALQLQPRKVLSTSLPLA